MSGVDDVLRLDPAMRIAREIGKQAGIDPEQMKEWYEQVCLGELHAGELFLRIEAQIKDPQLLETFRALRKNLSSSSGRDSRPSPTPAPGIQAPPSPPVA